MSLFVQKNVLYEEPPVSSVTILGLVATLRQRSRFWGR